MEEIKAATDEQQRRGLQEYIFDLEEIKEQAEELTLAHEKLKSSQDLLLAVLGCTVHGLCLMKEQRVVWCNQALVAIFGWEAEDLLGKTLEFLCPDPLEYARVFGMDKGRAGSGSSVRPCEFTHRSGRRVSCFISARALDDRDPARGVVFSITDVTDQIRSQKALQLAYAELQQRSAELLHSNQQLNREVEERKRAEQQLHAYREQLEELVEKRTSQLQTANKQLRQEVLDRRRAEEELKKSNDYLESIFQDSPDAIVIVDRHGRLVKWSNMVRVLYGAGIDKLKGRKVFELYADPQERDRMLAQLRQDGFVTKFEIMMKREQGGSFPVELSISLLRDSLGGTIGSVAISRDLSRMKRMVADLTRTNDRLTHEIAARQEVEDSLRESENAYRAIFENTGTATVILEADSTISLANAEYERLSGFSRIELEGRKKWTEFVVVEDLERMQEHHRARRLDPEIAPHQYEFRFRNRYGDIRHIFLTIELIPGTSKSVASLLDITERKEMEECLKESQQRLADIIDFLPDPTLVIDIHGRVIAWNRAMEGMTGIVAREMLGKGDYEYALPFYGKRRPILIDLALQPQPEIEKKYQYVTKRDGVLIGEFYTSILRPQRTYLSGKASVLHDSRGRVVGAIQSIRDITERKRVEEALAQAEEKYRSIFENAVMGIFQTTPEGRVVSANLALARMLGYDSPEEVIEKSSDLSYQLYVHSERRQELLSVIEEDGIVRDFEVQFYRKDGSIAWVTLNVRAVRNGARKITCLEGSVQDISDRRALEARLIQAQKMEAMGTLAGGIAHDFNNILAAIIGYSEMTKERLQQPKLVGYLDQVLKSSERAKNLVRQILTFSRGVEMEKRPVEVKSLITEVIKLLRATLPATIEIRQEISGKVNSVLADPTQIHQVLINLCTNAAHAMRERGGVLSVSLKNEWLMPNQAAGDLDLPAGHYVTLQVSDSGTGIPPEVMHRVFDPFFTTKKPGEGTGLGLSMVYGIVRAYGGAVSFRNQPGGGAAFTVHLPAISHDAAPRIEPTEVIPEGGREHILFVDDEEILRDMARDILGELGYEVTAARDGVEALGIFRTQAHCFDLVITDMTMPGMTGADLSRQVLRLRPEIPIILCTGHSDLIVEDEAKALGVREFLMKPYSISVIAELIRRVLEPKGTAEQAVIDLRCPVVIG